MLRSDLPVGGYAAAPKPKTQCSEEGQHVQRRNRPLLAVPKPKRTRRDSTSSAATDPSSSCQNPRGRGGTARPATQQTPPRPKNLKSKKKPRSAANGTTDTCCLVGLQHLQGNSVPAAIKNERGGRGNLQDSRSHEGTREEDMGVEEE
jgi:hypothetical protein